MQPNYLQVLDATFFFDSIGCMGMGELQFALTSGPTRIFFYVQTFIGNRTNGEESFDSHPP